ncbi:unnamed protein product [Rangifer tarandus platyrhynchus]|uniref:Uncharacterized protein n=1 Tax=Rangifer tarandus platyrhynchus TaxID=3082113 RepID=A0AC59YXC1_RANTA
MTAPGRLGPRPRRGSPPPLRFPTVPGIPSRAGSCLLGLTAETGVRGTDTDPRASFVSAPDTDGQTHSDKGTDRSSHGDARGVETRAPVYTGTHTHTQRRNSRVPPPLLTNSSPSEAPELRETETGLRQGPVLTAPPSVSTLGQAECSLPAARSLGAPRGGASEEGPVLRREGTSAGVLLLLCACLN